MLSIDYLIQKKIRCFLHLVYICPSIRYLVRQRNPKSCFFGFTSYERLIAWSMNSSLCVIQGPTSSDSSHSYEQIGHQVPAVMLYMGRQTRLSTPSFVDEMIHQYVGSIYVLLSSKFLLTSLCFIRSFDVFLI